MRLLKLLISAFMLFVVTETVTGNNTESIDQNLINKIDSLNEISYNTRRTSPKISLEYALKALELCKQTDYPKGYAESIHNRGIAKSIMGRFDAGLSDLMEASMLRESINDQKGLANTYNAIGFLFAEMGNDKKALEFYEKAVEIRTKNNYNSNLGIVLNNIGWVHYRAGKLDKALEFFYKALQANQDDGDDRGVGASQSNIGNVYRRIGDYQKGLDYHIKSLETGKKHDDKYGTINTLRYIAEDYIDLGKIEDATQYALKSLILAQEIGSVNEEKNSAALLAQIFEKRNKFPEATKYLKLTNRLKDSLFNVEKAEVIGHLQTAFELEAKEKENELLRAEQTINSQKIETQRYFLYISFFLIAVGAAFTTLIFFLNRKLKSVNIKLSELNQEVLQQKEVIEQKAIDLDAKNIELQEINQIKDKLISVIAHDLKNPLNSVAGYSEIIISRYDSYTKDEIISFLRIINDNGMRSNMLLDNLLQWSRLQTRTLPFIPSEQKLRKLVQDELYFVINIAAEKKVTIRTDIEEELYVTADANMLKTVVRNLLSNAIKFSRKGGNIMVSAENGSNETTISIKDNGMGINPEVKEKLFTGEAGVSTTGTAGEKGTGLGLMLCKDFIASHGGKIWVESEVDVGSTFNFTIPHTFEEN